MNNPVIENAVVGFVTPTNGQQRIMYTLNGRTDWIEYFQTEDEKVYFFEPLEKEISVEDMQKIVDANEKLVKEMKDGNK